MCVVRELKPTKTEFSYKRKGNSGKEQRDILFHPYSTTAIQISVSKMLRTGAKKTSKSQDLIHCYIVILLYLRRDNERNLLGVPGRKHCNRNIRS
jgi:hypothetical protein